MNPPPYSAMYEAKIDCNSERNCFGILEDEIFGGIQRYQICNFPNQIAENEFRDIHIKRSYSG